jgi:hypothetical protein
MQARLEKNAGRVTRPHRHQWLWQPLEAEPTFVLRPMFGGKAVYLGGKLTVYFAAKAEPWRGLLVATERDHHAALLADFPELSPHPVLPKWLYLPESADSFERTAARLVELARRRDPRIGVAPKPKKRISPSPARKTAGGRALRKSRPLPVATVRPGKKERL